MLKDVASKTSPYPGCPAGLPARLQQHNENYAAIMQHNENYAAIGLPARPQQHNENYAAIVLFNFKSRSCTKCTLSQF